MLTSRLCAVVRVIALCCFQWCSVASTNPDWNSSIVSEKPPTVLISVLVRNKAHTLPYFFAYLEDLNYPKDRLALWIRSDHNGDNSVELIQIWLNRTAAFYHNVDFEYDSSLARYHNESSPYDWPEGRFRHVIQLKEQALVYARKLWADFIFFLDADVFLTDPQTLMQLTKIHLPIVAPMLLSEGLYSNFWCGMTANYYYQRTEEYKQIYNGKKTGHFIVPMVHSAVLINLNYEASQHLTFTREKLIAQQEDGSVYRRYETAGQCKRYDGPLDDVIIFAISANCSLTPMYVSNAITYGYILQPLENGDSLELDLQQLVNIKTNIINALEERVKIDERLDAFVQYPLKTKLTLDKIYMINLERRPERRRKMELQFTELGLDVEHFPAIDGKKLTHLTLERMGIKFLDGYEDPYHRRQMTMGEVGCFLSHYRIWEEIVEKELDEVLILEDDVRFEPYFNERAIKILEQMRNVVEFDFIYFGRKQLMDEGEPRVTGTEHIVHAGYSYWTVGYVISLQGARKLIASKPLEKLIPVDEFLPVMFNRHPNKTLSAAYPKRNLVAFSAKPLILFPTHYIGDVGYISDTEDSEVTAQKSYAMKDAAQLKSDRERVFPTDRSLGNSNESAILDELFDRHNVQNIFNNDIKTSSSTREDL